MHVVIQVDRPYGVAVVAEGSMSTPPAIGDRITVEDHLPVIVTGRAWAVRSDLYDPDTTLVITAKPVT